MLVKTNKIIKKVAIFGDAYAKKTDQYFVDAYNTAKLLAENGYIIVNGGGPGVMLAATLGAKAGGGQVEIVLLDFKKKPKNFEGFNLENRQLADKEYKTKNYPDRLNKLIEVGDVFVVFDGGVGTLSEMGMAWQMAKFEYGDREHEPLIFFGDRLANLMKELNVGLNIDSLEKKLYQVVYTPEEVLKTIKERKGVNQEEDEKGIFGKIMKFFN
jgi:uncharacterized protein (TIGR00725 family)